MNLVDHLRDYAEFNVWANERIVAWLEPQPESILEQHVPCSFPSLKKTILHLWGAEEIWRLRFEKAEKPIARGFQFDGAAHAAFPDFLADSRRLAAFFAAQPDDWFFEMGFFRTLAGGDYSIPFFQAAHHVINHSTFHRGQIVGMAHLLGIAAGAPSTDFAAFCRDRLIRSGVEIAGSTAQKP